MSHHQLDFGYLNHRGEYGLRRIAFPKFYWTDWTDRLQSPYYSEPGWYVDGYDEEKKALRTFALAKMVFPPKRADGNDAKTSLPEGLTSDVWTKAVGLIEAWEENPTTATELTFALFETFRSYALTMAAAAAKTDRDRAIGIVAACAADAMLGPGGADTISQLAFDTITALEAGEAAPAAIRLRRVLLDLIQLCIKDNIGLSTEIEAAPFGRWRVEASRI